MAFRFVVVVLATLTLGTATATASQEAAEKPPATLEEVVPVEGISNENLDDAKIRSFVMALAAIQIVGNHYMPLIEAETDGSKRADIIDFANSDIVRAIEGIENITPAEYKAIDIASQGDAVLNQRILDELEVMKAENAKILEEQAKKNAEGEEPKSE